MTIEQVTGRYFVGMDGTSERAATFGGLGVGERFAIPGEPEGYVKVNDCMAVFEDEPDGLPFPVGDATEVERV